MPGGKVHSALAIASAIGVISPYAIVNLGGNPYWYIGGCLVGVLVGPDLDVDDGNISDTLIRKVSSPAQWLWRRIWNPYSKLIPHRHPISHFPVLSTAIRIGYLFVIINIFCILFNIILRLFGVTDTVSIVWFWNWSFFFGLCHVDTVHFLADKFIKGNEQFNEE